MFPEDEYTVDYRPEVVEVELKNASDCIGEPRGILGETVKCQVFKSFYYDKKSGGSTDEMTAK